MDIAADLETLRALFATRPGQPVAMVDTLREPAPGELLLWPYRLSEGRLGNALPPRDSPGQTRPAPAQDIHLLAIAGDPDLLGRARQAVHDAPVLGDGGRVLQVVCETLDTETLCRLFTAAGQPLRLALALVLRS